MVFKSFVPLPPHDERLLSRPPKETEVLIVGSGPAGLLTAYLLARRGIASAIVERHALRLNQPKAHAINPRSLEILRQAGLDTTALRRLGSSAEDAFWVRFVSGLTDYEVGKLPYERQDDAVREVTPEPLLNIAQPVLEDFLQEAALETGLVTIHRRWHWRSSRPDGEGAPVSRLETGEAAAHDVAEVRAEYVVGADGAESTVRAQLGNVEWAGPGGEGTPQNRYRSIHARGSLRRAVAADRRAQLYFCVHPAHRSGIIVYDLDGSFVHTAALAGLADAASADAATSEAACRAAVAACVGACDFRLESVTTWCTWPRVASAYSSADRRLVLVGDAAHSFPPQGGLGVNTGIADAHNLAWRLALLLDGGADRRLLDGYTAERRPVAVSNALQSAANEARWHRFMQLTAGLVADAAAQGVPAAAFFARPDIQRVAADAVATNRPHFDSLALQIGYVYGQASATAPPGDCGSFEPAAIPGARLPHAWIGAGRSVLDLVPEDGFVVFHQHGGFRDCSFPFFARPVHVGAVNVAELPVARQWKDLVSGSGKALLVRPDQHILAIVRNADEVEAALRAFLGLV